MTDVLGGAQDATREAVELAQSLGKLNAQTGPILKLINGIKDVFTWHNWPVTLAVMFCWGLATLRPRQFIMVGPHLFCIWTLFILMNQKVRKTHRTEAQLEADLKAEVLAREKAAKAAEEAKRKKEEEEMQKNASMGYLKMAFNYTASTAFAVTKTAASFLPVELPEAPDLADVAKQLDGVQNSIDGVTAGLTKFNAILYDLSWSDENKTFDMLFYILLSWIPWAGLLYFVPFNYILFVAGELGLIALSETGGLAINKLIRTLSGSKSEAVAPAANGDAKKTE